MSTIHTRVGRGNLLQRVFFDYWTNAGKHGELHGVFGIAGRAGSPALQALAAKP
jgi:hypothetical protein